MNTTTDSHSPIDEARAAAALHYDEQGRIADDLPCPQCGYNLRTMMPHADCPECGLAVQRAIWVARLRWYDPKWLGDMAAASAWFGIGVGSLLVLIAAMRYLPNDHLLWMSVPIAVSAVTAVCGCLLATTPNPDTVGGEWLFSRRRLARWSIVGSISFVMLCIILMVSEAMNPFIEDAMPWGIGALLIGVMLTLLHGRRTAAMIEQRMLVWATRIYAAMFVLIFAPLPALAIVNRWVGGSRWFWELDDWVRVQLGYDLYDLAELTVQPLPIIVLAIFSFLLMWMFRRRLRDAASMSRRRLEG